MTQNSPTRRAQTRIAARVNPRTIGLRMDMQMSDTENNVGRCVSPPSRSCIGPASPRRSVCAPGEVSNHCIADHVDLLEVR